ncbi:MAG: YhcH/YjgK/YiaL family protein [Verrucomicrobia bacterium]|nr:YhcH/YjgK/YiaL family protein [Verrucomicrobiota bacterium]
MAHYGSIPALRAQTAQLKLFAPAFAYLDDLLRPGSTAGERLRGLAEGDNHRVDLGGGVFALEQVYAAKVRADGFFESHRKFIDVQVVVAGGEAMEVADIGRMTVRQPYNPERDLIVYEDCTSAAILRVQAGEAAVFFPTDGHMPGLRINADATLVRKTVIKVPVPA